MWRTEDGRRVAPLPHNPRLPPCLPPWASRSTHGLESHSPSLLCDFQACLGRSECHYLAQGLGHRALTLRAREGPGEVVEDAVCGPEQAGLGTSVSSVDSEQVLGAPFSRASSRARVQKVGAGIHGAGCPGSHAEK